MLLGATLDNLLLVITQLITSFDKYSIDFDRIAETGPVGDEVPAGAQF